MTISIYKYLHSACKLSQVGEGGEPDAVWYQKILTT